MKKSDTIEHMLELAGIIRARRKRTAARLWVMRRKLRDVDTMLDAYNETTNRTPFYIRDVNSRRIAVQKTRENK